MDYLLFTYPNCLKCEALKKKLVEAGTAYTEYGLTQTQGKAKIREFINVIKRDETGAIKLPTLIAHTQGKAKIREFINVIKRDETGAIKLPTLIAHTQGIVRAVINTAEEFEAWSRSKA